MSYLGSKGASGAFQAIIASMPPHETYIEAFLGSGVVMRAKPPAARSIGVDLDPAALDLFRSLRLRDSFEQPLPASFCPPPPDLVDRDAIAFLEAFDYAAAGRVLVYADPPYLWSARSSDHRYRFEMTDDDHRRLAGVLRSIPAAVILSGYPSALYGELFGDWRSTTFQAMTRGGPRTEGLWFNFPAGDVAWSTFAGRGFTDRQRIKRKAARWAAMYAALAPGERLAVLAAILAAEGGDKPTAAQTPATMVAGVDRSRPT